MRTSRGALFVLSVLSWLPGKEQDATPLQAPMLEITELGPRPCDHVHGAANNQQRQKQVCLCCMPAANPTPARRPSEFARSHGRVTVMAHHGCLPDELLNFVLEV